MEDLLAARLQMAITLMFHIIFGVVGVGLPLLMVIAETRWLRTKKDVYLQVAKHWAHGTAIMFAIGAVSGTVVSFELGLLWPTFMEFAGPVIGMPFSLEGIAFFTEAIFLAIYLYGWHRIPPTAHLLSGIMVVISGACSALIVLTANSWMNTPAGFEIVNGQVVNVSMIGAIFNPMAVPQAIHMVVAAYVTVAFATAGIHAYYLRKDPRNLFHRKALKIALVVGAVFAIIQPMSGDFVARGLVKFQPLKLAALEARFETGPNAPLTIGGIPDKETRTVKHGIEIPYLLSILAKRDPHGVVIGLDSYPEEHWPPLVITHLAYNLMIGIGSFMILIGILNLYYVIKRRPIHKYRNYLMLLVLCGPLGFIAVEAGWVCAEVGRQPWIIYNIMKTADAVTPMKGIHVTFITFTLISIMLGFITVLFLIRQFRKAPLILSDSDDD